MVEQTQKVPKRILNNLLASVAAGVVPRSGAPYLAIGRKEEVAALLRDLEAVNEGSAAFRFLIGPYGSGKSFLIQLIRGYALERGFITADADLTPERRLYGTYGSGVATYRELMKNLSCRVSPDGGALPGILARWIDSVRESVLAEGEDPDSPMFAYKLKQGIRAILHQVESQVGGFDFARVIIRYYEAYTEGDDEMRSSCIRWLRGEFSTRNDAKRELGFSVSVIVNDENWYDFIKLWGELFRLIGYRGLIVFLDECVNLYKISNRISRENNYEKILAMFNDTLQGRASGLGIVMAGTPQFLEDTRRGLFSYEALRSRLCDSRFQADDFVNLIGPVIRLRRLSDDELLALLQRVTSLYAQQYNWDPNLKDEDMSGFLMQCLSRAGAETMITPREVLRDFMTVLNLMMQNPDVSFEKIIGLQQAAAEEAPRLPGSSEAFDPDDIQF